MLEHNDYHIHCKISTMSAGEVPKRLRIYVRVQEKWGNKRLSAIKSWLELEGAVHMDRWVESWLDLIWGSYLADPMAPPRLDWHTLGD